MKERKCKCGCGSNISHKHKNAQFLNQKHKDKYWNIVNPRGFYMNNSFSRCDERHVFDLED